MSTVPGTLKYLWTAIFEDGTQIDEPADDRYSKHDESAEANPSAFRDVTDKQEESKLIMFYLTNVETGDRIGVDLETGQFAINGIAFDAQEQNLDVTQEELQVVFFREVRKDTHMNPRNWVQEGEDHYINRYLIGWQIRGKKITQTIAVK